MPVDRQDLRRRLAQLAAAQSGHFTAQQALALGYSYAAQKHHADRGNWVRVERGIYRLPEWPVGAHDDLVRWSLWAPEGAAISHDSAASFHDLGDLNPADVHITVPRRFRGAAPGVRFHVAPLGEGDVSPFGGFRVTTPRRTIADLAEGAIGLDQLGTLVADAVDRGLVDPDELRSDAAQRGAGARARITEALALEGIA